MQRLFPLAVAFGLTASASPAAPPSESLSVEAKAASRLPLRETFDVRYYPGRGRQKLDVFAPAAAKKGERFPVVIFVHGGTWMVGDKNFFGLYRGVGRFLARNGLVAVVINYRLSPLVKHPEHTRDVARAFAWTCRNIDRYGGDPRRIVLAGHSAGAHLVSLAATDESYLRDPALKLTDRDRAGLCAVASLSGVYRIPGPAEFAAMVSRIVEIMVARSTPQSMARFVTPVLMAVGTKLNPFNLVFGKDRDVQTKASPLSHVRKGLPPFLVATAEYEVPGLKPMAKDFAAALRKAGNRVEVKEVPDCTHRSIVGQLHSESTEAGKMLLDFVRRHTR